MNSDSIERSRPPIDERVDSRLLQKPNIFLTCPLCSLLYLQPVINVKCGHSYCETCIIRETSGFGTVKCPMDSTVCDLKALVSNRVLQDQINDLEIRCRFSGGGDLKDGCQVILKYREILKHEESCDLSWIDCPNNSNFCGAVRRKDIDSHLDECQFNSCKFLFNGCNFNGLKSAVLVHEKDCKFQETYEGFPAAENLKTLKEAHKNSLVKINELSERISKIERNVSLLMVSVNQVASMKSVLPSGIEGSGYESLPIYSDPLLSKYTSIQHTKLSDEEYWVMPFQFKCIGTMKCHKSSVTSIALRNRTVFSSDSEANIKMWSLDALQRGCLVTLKAGTKKINALIIHDEHLYSAGDDREIKCWKVTTLDECSSVKAAHDKSIVSLICFADKLVSSSYKNIKIWKCTTLELVHTISEFHHWVRALATNFSADVLYSGDHGAIEMWNTFYPFDLKNKIVQPIGSVYSLAVTKDYIIAGTYNKNIYLFDVSNHQQIHHFFGHVGITTALNVSPSEKFFVTGSSDTTLLLWCLTKMLPVQTLQRHDGSVTSVAVYDDILLSGSEDTEIKIFKQFKC